VTRIAALAAFAMLLFACEDPVLEARAKSLGPDKGPYEEGPYHRAGDPCTWCHTEGGSADSSFDLAGTVYARRDSTEPLPAVQVRLFDANGGQLTLESNQAGNFFVPDGELSLEFPMWVKLEYQGEVTAMQTPIRRERSCAACHMDPRSPTSAGRVYFVEDE
jgi:hypothetical protein